MLGKVGVFCDGSNSSEKALELCKNLYKDNNVEVILCTFINNEEKEFQTIQNLHQQCKIKLQPLNVISIIIKGDARCLMKSVVEDNNIQLSFFGTRGLSSIGGLLHGSVSQYALHHCPSPVIFTKEICTPEPKNFGVFYDFSAASEKALYLAFNYTRVIHICTCVERPPTDTPWGYTIDEADSIASKNKEKARTRLHQLQTQLQEEKNIESFIHIRVGDPRAWIEPIVSELNLGILFLGSRGYSTELTGFFVGSTSQYALHNASIPVAILH